MIRSEMIVIFSQALTESVSKREVEEAMRRELSLWHHFQVSHVVRRIGCRISEWSVVEAQRN